MGRGAATQNDRSEPGGGGNGNSAAPFLGIASKIGNDVVDLWVMFGLGLLVVVWLIM